MSRSGLHVAPSATWCVSRRPTSVTPTRSGAATATSRSLCSCAGVRRTPGSRSRRARTGRARARGAVRTAGGRGTPRPGGHARRTRGGALRLRHTSPVSGGLVGRHSAGAWESSRSACGAVGKGWHTRSSSGDPLTPVGRFAKVFHHKQSGAHCATTSVERLGAWQTCSWTTRAGARWPETTGRSDAPPGAPPRRREPLPHAATAVRVPRCPDRPGG